MARYEAYLLKGWENKGITRVVFTRTREGGWLEAGVFLVDAFCLGVKDAFLIELQSVDWQHELNRMIPADERVAMHPACARKFIEGAVAYAEGLGVAPHRDYRKARRAFGSIRAADCPDNFTYGNKGKPFFIAGPHDDEERIDRVMALLTAKLGPGGFNYLLPADEDESDADDDPNSDDAEVGEHIDEFFRALGRENVQHTLGGMCAAVALRPPDIEPEDLIPILWHGQPPASWNADDAAELDDLITDLWSETEDRLDFTDEDEPELVPNFADDPSDEAELRDRARLWCRGFLRAVRAWPDEWEPVFARTELQRHMGVIAAIAEEGPATTLDDPIPADELPSAVGTALLALREAFPSDVDD